MKILISIMIYILVTNVFGTCNFSTGGGKELFFQSSQGVVFPLMQLIEEKQDR